MNKNTKTEVKVINPGDDNYNKTGYIETYLYKDPKTVAVVVIDSNIFEYEFDEIKVTNVRQILHD